MYGYDFDFWFPWYFNKVEFEIFDHASYTQDNYPMIYWASEDE